MKKCVLVLGLILFLISFGKSKKQNDDKHTQEEIFYYLKDSIKKKEINTPIYNHGNYECYVEKVDTTLLFKIASNLKIPYSDINVEESSSIDFNNSITFLVFSFKMKYEEQPNSDNIEYSIERKYVFVSKRDGKILDEETDSNLSYFNNEATGFSKSYVLKNIIKLNDTTNAIALKTETSGGGRISLYSRQLFTIITLEHNKIKKILYEYPVRKTQGESNGGGSFQMEVLETDISVSNLKTNGFYDLIVAKTFSYEEEVEEDLEKGIKEKVEPIKIKKESERIKYNGSIYVFKKDDKYRFLDYD